MADAERPTFAAFCLACGKTRMLKGKPRSSICQPCAASAANGRHRSTGSRLYRIWVGMKTRVRGQNGKDRKFYVDKGITLCEEWWDFEAFSQWASANGYADNLSIDRIDGSQGYHPANCRWSTAREQSWNSSKVTPVTFQGRTMPIRGWAEVLGIKPGTLWARLRQSGMDVEKAFTLPPPGKV